MDLKQFSHHYDHLLTTVSALKRAICNKLVYQVAKNPASARAEDWLHAVSYAVRDHLVERWMETIGNDYEQDVKRVFYLSMEFLIGRTFSERHAGPRPDAHRAPGLARAGGSTSTELLNLEPDAALGNGGLGRLAACFLDSMATQGIAGLRLRHPLRLRACSASSIVDGQQVEVPDYWLTHGNPWEFRAPEIRVLVRFGGRLEEEGKRVRWVDTEDVLAMAYDQIIPGYGTKVTNTLRLWSAKATEEIDLVGLQPGQLLRRGRDQDHSENVLAGAYPDDSTLLRPRAAPAPGVFLRLGQPARTSCGRYLVSHRLRRPARQGQHPPQRHPPGAGDTRADAPPARRARARLERAPGAVPARVLVHQPYA